MPDEAETGQGGIDAHFFRLVATFEAAAMQQLGKIASPLTGEVEVTLDGARDSIDMLDMMRRKCDGNMNPNEERLLEHVLYQLRMNYVEVSKETRHEGSDGEGAAGGPGEEPAETGDRPPGDDAAGGDAAPAETNGSGDEGPTP